MRQNTKCTMWSVERISLHASVEDSAGHGHGRGGTVGNQPVSH